MKSTIQRVLFAVAVATFGAGAVGTACAQSSSASSAPTNSPQHHGRRGHFRGFGGPLVGTLLRATKQLGTAPGTQGLALTSAQQAQIKSLLTAAHPHHQPGTGTPPQGSSFSLLADLGNSGVYSSAVTTAEQTAATRSQERIQKQSALAEQIWTVLAANPNQQAAVKTILQTMQAKQEARRAQWAASHTAGNG